MVCFHLSAYSALFAFVILPSCRCSESSKFNLDNDPKKSEIPVFSKGSAVSASYSKKNVKTTVNLPSQQEPWRQEMIDLMNGERDTPLCFNSKLNQVAQEHSDDMTINDFFGHEGSDGSSTETRLFRVGYDYFFWAQNIGLSNSVEGMHQAFMDTNTTRANIVNPLFFHVGLGRTKQINGTYAGSYYFTQLFASSYTESCDDSGSTTDDDCVDDPVDWYDSDGSAYNCQWYAEGDNCEVHGDKSRNFGKTANEACCSCGGGTTPTPFCEDYPDWYDSDGPQFTCEWYALDNNCALHGDCCKNFKATANEACCVCGGGISSDGK